MELDFAVLAEAATTSGDGKMNLLGCGYDIFVSPAVPCMVPRITLAARFLLRPTEAEASHPIEIALIDGDGKDVIPPRMGSIRTLPGRLAGAMIPYPFILEMGPVSFPRHGPYSFEIRIGRRATKSVPLYVVPRL